MCVYVSISCTHGRTSQHSNVHAIDSRVYSALYASHSHLYVKLAVTCTVITTCTFLIHYDPRSSPEQETGKTFATHTLGADAVTHPPTQILSSLDTFMVDMLAAYWISGWCLSHSSHSVTYIHHSVSQLQLCKEVQDVEQSLKQMLYLPLHMQYILQVAWQSYVHSNLGSNQ